MNRGKTLKINDKEYTLTAYESKIKKIRGIDEFIGVELEIGIFNVEENRKLQIKEIRALGIDKYLLGFSKDSFNGINLFNWYVDNIEEKYSAILQDKLTLENDIAHIQMQLETAKDQLKYTGIQSDVTWYRKAKQALLMKQMELKKLNIIEMELRTKRKSEKTLQRIRDSNTKAKMFERIAHSELDPDIFNKLMDKAKQALREKGIEENENI